MKAGFLIGGLAVGAVVAWKYRHNSLQEIAEPVATETPTGDGDWSMAERIALGAAGGGLLLFGMRSKGKLARVASLAGAGMLARSVRDEPVHELSDVISPRALLVV